MQVQSTITTLIRGQFTLMELRILLRIVEYAQQPIKGVRCSQYLGTTVPNGFGREQVAIASRDILTDGSNHYEDVRTAAKSLMKKVFEHYDSATNRYRAACLIDDVIITPGEGKIIFSVSPWVMQAILDFSKGFSRYDLHIALQLPTSNAVRFYMLFCGQLHPVLYPIEFLKITLGVQDKYTQTKDFINKVVEASRLQLDRVGANSFTYSRVWQGHKVTGLHFFPAKHETPSNNEVVAKGTLGAFCPVALKSYLQTQCQFTPKELSAHKDLLMQFGDLETWPDDLQYIIENQRKKRAGKGYVINAMKNVVNKAHGIID